jgi:subtilisin-like proprotein convertase family protein
MNRILLLCSGLLLAAVSSMASITTNFNYTSLPNSGYIPDNDPNGWASTINLSGTGLTVQDVTVTLSVSGGWNGDLYGYLVHDTGGFVVLMDQVGKDGTHTYGFGNAGFDNITIASTGSSLTTLGVGGASYSASGPISSGTYAAQGGTTQMGSFAGTSVDGAWSLFFADRSGGDISQVTGWSLTINAVPEPTTWAMMFFGAVFGGWQFVSWRKKVS